ncbi:uncharacterized protein V1510DRAFT_164891 [Dipodascopsis tothii]|uniref:uncharacterized protein n=1 Tax=Dipodascopsis tothii TaxID=44089 RepID=UPI0034CD93C2
MWRRGACLASRRWTAIVRGRPTAQQARDRDAAVHEAARLRRLRPLRPPASDAIAPYCAQCYALLRVPPRLRLRLRLHPLAAGTSVHCPRPDRSPRARPPRTAVVNRGSVGRCAANLQQRGLVCPIILSNMRQCTNTPGLHHRAYSRQMWRIAAGVCRQGPPSVSALAAATLPTLVDQGTHAWRMHVYSRWYTDCRREVPGDGLD